MGFFKRIFSFGRKKKQKLPEASTSANSSTSSAKPSASNSNAELEHEAEIGRLLRSSSARYHVVSETDATSLPPLPHPINNIAPVSAASTLSLASTAAHLKGTYNVTIHGRTKHSDNTGLYDARMDGDVAHDSPDGYTANEKERSQLLRLRADPSVASLLDMYDENGQIASDAFDGSPLKEGRAQVRRSRSTLRQLLGDPSTTSLKIDDGAVSEVESDISWAERFLSEHETCSAESSIQIRTPDTFTTGLPADTSDERTYRMDKDMSALSNPAVDSLEVEFSMNEDSIISAETSYSEAAFSQRSEPVLSQRASQVFAFIHEKRRNKPQDLDDKSMADVYSIAPTITHARPSASKHTSSVSRHGDAADDSMMSSSSGESSMPSTSFANVSTSTTPRRTPRYPSTLSRTPKAFPTNRMSATSDIANISEDTAILMAEVPYSAPVLHGSSKTPPSRIPLAKGRRESLPEVGQKRRRVDTMGERGSSVPLEEEERHRSAIPRPRKHRRAASQGPTTSYETSELRAAKRPRRSTGGSCVLGAARVTDWKLDQENSTDFVQVDWIDSPVKFSKPTSPVRAKSESRILSRLDPHRDLPITSSDDHRFNSSSELSPVARQMMFKARQERRRTTDPYSQEDRPDRWKFGFRG